MDMSHIGDFFGNSYMAFNVFYCYITFLMTAAKELLVSQTAMRI